MISYTHSLKDGTHQIQFFSSMERFLVHIKDHFCNEKEPWSRLLGQKRIRQFCQKINKSEVTPIETIETIDFYEKVVSILNDGIKFSASYPLYAMINENVSYLNINKSKEQITVYFLSYHGYVIICSDNIVKTAYFIGNNPHDAYFSLFKNGWKKINAQCGKKEYFDNKGKTHHKRLAVIKENTENWEKCPNPHLKKKSKK
jgi:hypothetical protein